ncbi:MAG: hypothetical protein ACLRI8_07775 [Agathobacter rectalis]
MESGSKYNRTKHPVTSHANPHCNRTKAPYTAEVYAQTYTAKPHCAAGYNHGEFHIACGTQPIWRMKDGTQQIGLTIVIKVIISKQSRALAGSIPASIVMGFVSMKIIRQLAMITTSDTSDSF